MLSMPKFTLGGDSIELKAKLVSLGMDEAFTERADFSGINEGRRLRIDSVVHQAVIDVSRVIRITITRQFPKILFFSFSG